MMEVCSDATDSQTAKLDEFVLVAHRIRKAGLGARPGLSKYKLRPKNDGNARASSLMGGKNLLALLFRHRQSSAKLLPHRSLPIPGKRSVRREGS